MRIRNQTVKVASIFWVLLLALGPVAINDALKAQDTTSDFARNYSHGSTKSLVVNGVSITVEIPPGHEQRAPQLLADGGSNTRGPASVKTKIESQRQ